MLQMSISAVTSVSDTKLQVVKSAAGPWEEGHPDKLQIFIIVFMCNDFYHVIYVCVH